MFGRSPSRFDLKLRLTLRVAAVAALSFAIGATYALVDADRALWRRGDQVAAIVAHELELQKEQQHWLNFSPNRFPDLQTVAGPLESPGFCIAFRPAGGPPGQRMCSGRLSNEPAVLRFFSALCRSLMNRDRQVVRPVAFGGRSLGEAVVSIDIDARIANIWLEAGRIVPVMAIALSALCVLVYAAMARALRPTILIRQSLRRLAADDLTTRLPPFDLAELSEIRQVFNALAQKLESGLAERNRLTRMLIEVQDEERSHLARDMHDEFGQYLTAINAMAASAGQTASRDCPALLPECQSIARSVAHVMEALKGALVRLRPPDVEELGLVASLESLVGSWNGFAHGRMRFDLDVRGEFDDLSHPIGTNLYRIAQEAITNAVKHARASRVALRLRRFDREGSAESSGGPQVELTVEDDGPAGPNGSLPRPGLGLLGIQERVGALGGRLEIEHGAAGGLILHAKLPLK